MIWMAIGFAITWSIIAGCCFVVYQLMVHNGRLVIRVEQLERRLGQAGRASMGGLPVGTTAFDFALPDLSGTPMRLSNWRGRRVLLIFFDPTCRFCVAMLRELAQVSAQPADGRPVLLVVTTGDVHQNRELFETSGVRVPVLVQRQKEIAVKFAATGTPTGYLIDEQLTIASELAQGAEALLSLARGAAPETGPSPLEVGPSFGDRGLGLRVRGSGLARDGLRDGTPAPLFRLPRVGGGELALEDYRGQSVLLVFSDPVCGPCNELAPKLERVHRQALDLEVLMVSRGSPSANEAKIAEHRLTFPVVLQRHWEISRMYAMFATPIAYLLDEHLTVAADVAVGPEAIVRLATRRMTPGRSIPSATASASR